MNIINELINVFGDGPIINYLNNDDNIDNILKNNKILIKANTGTGKTTIIPYCIYLNELKNSNTNKIILVIIPTKNSIINTYDYMKSKKFIKPIKLGISTYEIKSENIEDSDIIYTTYGFFENCILNKKYNFLNKISTIIFDEQHTIINNVSYILMILYIMKIYKNIKYIFLSATPVDIYKLNLEDAFILNIPYKKHEIYMYTFNNDTRLSNIDTIVICILLLIKKKNDINSPILIFVNSVKNTVILTNIFKLLFKNYSDNNYQLNEKGCEIFYLHASQDHDEQKIIFDKLSKNNKKKQHFIFATNIIETGTTINNLCIIDTGCSNIKKINPSTICYSLISQNICKEINLENTLQRAGRSGRTSEGLYINIKNFPFLNTFYSNFYVDDNIDVISEYQDYIKNSDELLEELIIPEYDIENNSNNNLEITINDILKLYYYKFSVEELYKLNISEYIIYNYHKKLLKLEAINDNNKVLNIGLSSILYKNNIEPKFIKLIKYFNEYSCNIIPSIFFINTDIFNYTTDTTIISNRKYLYKKCYGDLLIGHYLFFNINSNNIKKYCDYYDLNYNNVNKCISSINIYIKTNKIKYNLLHYKEIINIIIKSNILSYAKKNHNYYDCRENINFNLFNNLPNSLKKIISRFFTNKISSIHLLNMPCKYFDDVYIDDVYFVNIKKIICNHGDKLIMDSIILPSLIK